MANSSNDGDFPFSRRKSEFPFNRRRNDKLSSPETRMSSDPTPSNIAPTTPSTGSKPAPATPAQTGGRERRRSARLTLVAKATIRPDVSVVMPTLVTTGFVSNISMGGIGFHTRQPLAVGGKYRLNLELGPMKWTSRLKVVSCQVHDTGTFDIGAEFVGNELSTRPGILAA